MSDYTPSVYYQPSDDLDAATPNRVVIDTGHECEYREAEVADIDDCAPTLRATELAAHPGDYDMRCPGDCYASESDCRQCPRSA